MSLSGASRLPFGRASDMVTDIPAEGLNRFPPSLVSELFAQRVRAHLSCRDAPRGYVADIIAGSDILDQPAKYLE